MARPMTAFLYVTDDNGREMLIASLLSLREVCPTSRVFIAFTGLGFDLPPLFDYEYVDTVDIGGLYSAAFPNMLREDGRRPPKATMYKIPAIASLPPDVDEVIYLDIDTVIHKDPGDIFDYSPAAVLGTHNLGIYRSREPINAGVMGIRRSLLPVNFLQEYIDLAINSAGRCGDQELLKYLTAHIGIVPTYFNSKRLSSQTRVIHAYGTKPFELYPESILMGEEDLNDYWKEVEANLLETRIPDKDYIRRVVAASREYMVYYQRAVMWLVENTPNYKYIAAYSDGRFPPKASPI